MSITVAELISNGTMSAEVAATLWAAVDEQRSFLTVAIPAPLALAARAACPSQSGSVRAWACPAFFCCWRSSCCPSFVPAPAAAVA